MVMKADARGEAAALLIEAARSGRPAPPLSERFALDLDDAYAIQVLVNEPRIGAGHAVLGHKVGLTSKAMQEMLGVDEPDYGVLLDDMFYEDGATVPATRFLQPRVEVEIAFRLREPLAGPGVTAADVLGATEAVAASIEIIDSRIADWRITLADTIADNASSGAVVLGAWVRLADAPALPAVEVVLRKNGHEEARGAGRDVLGDPAEAVAWLANTLARLGTSFDAGHVVMPGSCTRAVAVAAGDHIEASFEGLGEVSVAFG
jgi:2-oxo-3-hexenedioate decarboxylase/2-keto-4-pentenoate hydratase